MDVKTAAASSSGHVVSSHRNEFAVPYDVNILLKLFSAVYWIGIPIELHPEGEVPFGRAVEYLDGR